MQRLEVSGAVRLVYRSLGVKGLKTEKNSEYFIRRPLYVYDISFSAS